MLQAEHFQLERNAPGAYRLRWPQQPRRQSVVAISAGASFARLNASVAIDADNCCAEIDNLEVAPRHFFRVQTRDGRELMIAERRLLLEGAQNFRDFGGYTNNEGRQVRWGRLFRSDQLSLLSAEDQLAVAELGIGLICDFRHDGERQRAPNLYAPHHQPRIENLAIGAGSTSDIFAQLKTDSSNATAELMVQLMVEINRELALKQSATYQKLFSLLVESNGPILIHCAAGKDRTGFGAALVLAALGVSEELLMQDYLLTEKYLPVERKLQYIKKKYQVAIDDAVLRPALEVRREYLRAALDAVDTEFGSLQGYLRDGLAVTAGMQSELRRTLLED